MEMLRPSIHPSIRPVEHETRALPAGVPLVCLLGLDSKLFGGDGCGSFGARVAVRATYLTALSGLGSIVGGHWWELGVSVCDLEECVDGGGYV